MLVYTTSTGYSTTNIKVSALTPEVLQLNCFRSYANTMSAGITTAAGRGLLFPSFCKPPPYIKKLIVNQSVTHISCTVNKRIKFILTFFSNVSTRKKCTKCGYKLVGRHKYPTLNFFRSISRAQMATHCCTEQLYQ